jgi:hypothetical protein
MPFEIIENVAKLAAQIKVFPDGVRVEPKVLTTKKGVTRYIKVTVGAQLAKKLIWRDEKTRIDLAFGTGRDAGKVRASVNLTAGQFIAGRDKQGRYTFTINAATAEGLFSLDFPAFDIDRIDPVSELAKPPALVFKASDEMLEAAD